jgi:hypothetical protein
VKAEPLHHQIENKTVGEDRFKMSFPTVHFKEFSTVLFKIGMLMNAENADFLSTKISVFQRPKIFCTAED